MTSTNIYLNFNGNCLQAFEFYKSIFGGDFIMLSRFKDMPADTAGGNNRSPEDGDRVMHVSLATGQNSYIMGSDTGGEWAAHYKQGNNFSISINAESKEEADKLFAGLSAGGQTTMPMADTFWGDYFGMLTDKFGINWMISANANHQK